MSGESVLGGGVDGLARVAALLVGAPSDGIDAAISAALAVVCEEIGAVRASIGDAGVLVVEPASGADRAAVEAAARPYAALFAAAVRRAETDRRLIVELTDARDRAETADRANSRFLSRASHELRTPLAVVTGFTQLLRTAEDPGEVREYVERISAAGTHLLSIVDDILDSVRFAEPAEPDQRTPVRVGALVRDVVGLVEADARDAGVEVHLGIDDAPVVFVAEPLLRRVLLNLLTNAVKYNRHGGRVDVGIRVCGDELAIEVADTGIGIPPELKDRLFQPFDRLDAENTPVDGTGLGLTIALAAAQRMGGRLEYLDRPGGGTRAIVTVPYLPVEDRGPAAMLVVDDDAGMRALLRLVLERQGHAVLVASDGGEGLHAFRTAVPAVALVDLGLPDMPGVEVIRTMRSVDRGVAGRVGIVALTGDGTAEAELAAFGAGADVVLLKPVTRERLVEVVGELLARF